MFDIQDVAIMKKSVGISDRELDDESIMELKTFWEIRLFKEKIFPNGPWNNVATIVVNKNSVEQQ